MAMTNAMAAGVAGLLAAAGAGECLAQTAMHRDRSAWAAAIDGIDVALDFSEYTADADFRDQPLAMPGGMTFRQVGNTTLHEFRNFIDAPEFRYIDNNGTPHLSGWVDFAEAGQTGIRVEIDFERPLAAWGAEFWGAATAERLHVVAVSTRGVELGVLEATRRHSDESEFMGFIAPSGEAINKVILRSRRRYLGTVGEGFGMDNIALKFGEAPALCYADCDSGSGPESLDIFDFLCFQTRFAALDPWACDCHTANGPGVCDIFDFLCFLNAFDAGCP